MVTGHTMLVTIVGSQTRNFTPILLTYLASAHHPHRTPSRTLSPSLSTPSRVPHLPSHSPSPPPCSLRWCSDLHRRRALEPSLPFFPISSLGRGAMSRRSGGGSLSPPVPSSTRRNGEQEIRWPSSGSPSPHLWPAQGAVRGDPRAHEGWRSGGLLIAAPSWPLAAAARASLAAAARASLAAAAPSRAARTSELLGYGLYATQGA
jgi:hypothetical protein